MRHVRKLVIALVFAFVACKNETASNTVTTTGTDTSAQNTVAAAATPSGRQTRVNVHVTGFCTFVHPTDAEPANEPMILSLIDARGASAKHVPLIMYMEADEQTAPPANRNAKTMNLRKYFELQGDRLTFSTVSTSGNDLRYDTSAGDDCNPNGSMYYIPHLRDLAKKKPGDAPSLKVADLDTAFFGPSADPKKVAALTDVTFGQLQTGFPPPPIVVWDFKPIGTSDVFRSQSVAKEVTWSFLIDTPVLTVSTVPIGSSAAPTTLVELKPNGGKNTIELTIVNLIETDIPILTKAQPLKISTTDDHFPMYYNYIRGYGGPRPRPDKQKDCPPPTGPTPVLVVGGLNCGPDQLP